MCRPMNIGVKIGNHVNWRKNKMNIAIFLVIPFLICLHTLLLYIELTGKRNIWLILLNVSFLILNAFYNLPMYYGFISG